MIVTLTNVQPGATQNALFGDDIYLTVHTAKTHVTLAAPNPPDYLLEAFTTGGTWTFNNPENGYMRITVNGDWTNASPINATINILSVKEPTPQSTLKSKIVEGDAIIVPFTVPAGALTLTARAEWREDWSAYPTHDIDVTLVRPNGTLVTTGATLNSPEIATVANPPAGNWFAIVEGFTIHAGDDKVDLRIDVDGEVVK